VLPRGGAVGGVGGGVWWDGAGVGGWGGGGGGGGLSCHWPRRRICTASVGAAERCNVCERPSVARPPEIHTPGLTAHFEAPELRLAMAELP